MIAHSRMPNRTELETSGMYTSRWKSGKSAWWFMASHGHCVRLMGFHHEETASKWEESYSVSRKQVIYKSTTLLWKLIKNLRKHFQKIKGRQEMEEWRKGCISSPRVKQTIFLAEFYRQSNVRGKRKNQRTKVFREGKWNSSHQRKVWRYELEQCGRHNWQQNPNERMDGRPDATEASITTYGQ